MNELQEGPLAPVSTHAAPAKLSRRDERRLRRRRRKRGEEIVGWIVVPIILIGIYWGVTAGFEFFGTTPGTVWDQLMQVKAMMEKGK